MNSRDLSTHSSRTGHAVFDVFTALGTLTRAIGNLVSVFMGGHYAHQRLYLREAKFMYIVKNNQAPVNYALDFSVVDAEGQPVTNPSGMNVLLESDTPSAVEVTPDPSDPKKGQLTFGSASADGTPAVASLVATISLADGTVVGSFGDQITVTAGDPAAISGGRISLEGLTPAEDTPPQSRRRR